MNEQLLARVGGVLALASLTIFAVGLLVQMAGDRTAFATIIAGGTGLVLVVSAVRLILLSGAPGTTPSAIGFLRKAALASLIIALAGCAAAAIVGPSLVTALVLGLVGLQAPIVLMLAAGFLAGAGLD
ncbi:hypothetical protein [Trueperella pecoris]|uniref:Uncharacterized protein n=1 Tax=Trueperella pecoris TaxID=2733571 RepID=A0A7M1QXH5_9ACTO|nr:hypothetical protein [Trueperella pecoris]QOQ39323.1 hypothetical protein HLG82_07635 [Trueperella pecoris]QOR46035.1 hypothetical protein INS88_02095 [Trueperella pecoris]QTG75866.1 hypothetical protein J4179_02015 [Trueperella pecoris]